MNCYKKVTWAISAFFILSFSCTSPVEKIEGIPRIEISEDNISAFDEAVTSISFIPLKNQLETPVNLNCGLWDLFATDEYLIYVTKCNPNFVAHFFDLEGNYLMTFDKQGEGPEEYQFIQGINVDQDTLSFSAGAGDIKQYLIPSFEFAGSLSLGKPMFVASIAEISKNNWLFSSMFEGDLDANGKFNLYKKIDVSTGETVDLPIKANQLTNEISEGEIEKIGDIFLLNHAFADTLFLYDGIETKPYTTLDFGARHPSQEDLNMKGEGFEAAIANQPFVINMGKIWQTDSISHLKTFALAKNPELDLGNMRTFPIHEVFINHRTNKAIAFPSVVGWTNGKGDAIDGWFYEVLQVDDWINALEKGLFGSHGDKLEELLSGLENFEDPIVIKYKVTIKD
ncbi:6-bladed beta-propeller [Algoriphagus chordae]|uniref:6-bladed beta-propeller protein n=1 Tax=Algoriphagus chordae TaxID=237019 RepID=A0A2W7QML0_9BACT|nr:6-bladed beta-propeller [Algoriphagus chordae]PZX49351.1 6-bladed beta-propeller protein [Algoriphagus chordae]